MKAALIYPHTLGLPNGAILRVGQFIEYLKARVDSLEVFIPDAGEEKTAGNVSYLFEPYDLSPVTPWLPFAPASDGDATLDAALCDFTAQLRILATQKNPNDLEHLGISATGIDMLWTFFRIFNNRRILDKIRGMIARADVVFVEYPFWVRWIVPLCREAGALSIVTVYDVLSVSCPDKKGPIAPLIWQLERDAMKMPDHACVVSEADAAVFGKAGVPVLTVPNPIDCRKAAEPFPPKILQAMRAKYGIPEGPVAFFVGGAWFLNQHAVQAIGATAPQVPECTFVVAGACAPAFRDKNFISLGIVGERELQALYRLATLILVPLEGGTGSSLKFIEAMSHGKPIIATPPGARGYPVTAGRELVLIQSAAELPARIRELLADAARREALGRAAAAFAQDYHFEKVFAPYGRWIEELRGKKAGAAGR